mmetsp:Transcript_224/g.342  ORF Transcript_224/g.342 Transcript_224/m.342 type:complete len:594 (-) Transcript_224:987-2768(-)
MKMTLQKQTKLINNRFEILILFFYYQNVLHRAVADKFCGVDLGDAQNKCWQPCGSNNDCCSTGQSCFETGSACGSGELSGTDRYYCGVTWCDAAYSCGIACPNQDECPEGTYCFADTPCGYLPPPQLPPPPTTSSTQFCGTTVESATENCWQPCPRGNSDCCLGLSCFDTSTVGTCNGDYSGSQHFYCGRSWCDAAYTCQIACPGGTNDECPDGYYCYADTPCNPYTPLPPALPPTANPPPAVAEPPLGAMPSPQYKYCGTDYGDATSRCWQPCESNSDCCFGQSCFDTGSGCGPPLYDGPEHSYCGTSFCDAITKCGVACPNGNECPAGESCWDATPCNSLISSTQPFYCGLGFAEAGDKCWQPCPSGQDSECCFGQSCFDTGGSCLTAIDPSLNRRYCGTDLCDASYKCTTACPGGTDAECPSGESCFDNTPCSSYDVPPSFEFAYCGTPGTTDVECWQPCRDNADCCFDQECIATATSCEAPNFQGSSHFFCGYDFCDAAFRCSTPCPTGYSSECPIGESCYANTPCDADVSGFGLPRSALNLALQFNSKRGLPASNSAFSSFNDMSQKNLVSFMFGMLLVLSQGYGYEA